MPNKFAFCFITVMDSIMAAAAMEAVDRVQQELMMTTAATTIMVRLTSAVLLSFRIHRTYCGGNRALG